MACAGWIKSKHQSDSRNPQLRHQSKGLQRRRLHQRRRENLRSRQLKSNDGHRKWKRKCPFDSTSINSMKKFNMKSGLIIFPISKRKRKSTKSNSPSWRYTINRGSAAPSALTRSHIHSSSKSQVPFTQWSLSPNQFPYPRRQRPFKSHEICSSRSTAPTSSGWAVVLLSMSHHNQHIHDVT